MTLHKIKIQSTNNNQIQLLNPFSRNISDCQREFKDFLNKIESQKKDLSNRTLIIVPGYSVSNPPRIGHHRYYIKALKYHPTMNPYGYKRVYLFDIYSKKDGRCNFNYNITQLAEELFNSINTNQNEWIFTIDGEIDFIGASMGGLIVRKFIQDYVFADNQLITNKWGILKIENVILIATPNHGCVIIDRLQSPIVQFLLRLFYGKKNYSKCEQIKQIACGKTNVFGKLLSKLFSKKSEENIFLRELNSKKIISNTIRWITIRGTKSKWYSCLFYNKNEENDGVVSSSSVILEGAENIADKHLFMKSNWDHGDLYKNDSVCKLLFGLLSLNLKLDDYLIFNQLYSNQNIINSQLEIDNIFNKIKLDNIVSIKN